MKLKKATKWRQIYINNPIIFHSSSSTSPFLLWPHDGHRHHRCCSERCFFLFQELSVFLFNTICVASSRGSFISHTSLDSPRTVSFSRANNMFWMGYFALLELNKNIVKWESRFDDYHEMIIIISSGSQPTWLRAKKGIIIWPFLSNDIRLLLGFKAELCVYIMLCVYNFVLIVDRILGIR